MDLASNSPLVTFTSLTVVQLQSLVCIIVFALRAFILRKSGSILSSGLHSLLLTKKNQEKLRFFLRTSYYQLNSEIEMWYSYLYPFISLALQITHSL